MLPGSSPWWIGSIPSPSSSGYELGPLHPRYYGLCIAFGIIAGVWLIARRLPGRRLPADLASELSVPGVVGGFVGARLYNVITDWQWDSWYRTWEGGLGIPGAILGGALAVVAWSKYKGYPIPPLFDVAAPAMPLAQAIGRVGNWFNQELFGRPLDTFWGLEIDPQYRPPGYESYSTFHPTFLYEALWNLALCAGLLWLDSKRVLKPGRLFLFYTGGYAVGRLWIESLRIDHATEILGLRVNYWTMGFVLAVSVIWIARDGFRSPGEIDPYRTGEKVVTSPESGGSDATTDPLDTDTTLEAVPADDESVDEV